MTRTSYARLLLATAAAGLLSLSAAQAVEGERKPLWGKTDSLGDPGRIGPNGALHKNVRAGDFFTYRDLAEMDLHPDDIIPLTQFIGLPRSAPRDDLDSPYPQR